MQRGATAVIFDTTDDPSAVEEVENIVCSVQAKPAFQLWCFSVNSNLLTHIKSMQTCLIHTCIHSKVVFQQQQSALVSL